MEYDKDWIAALLQACPQDVVVEGVVEGDVAVATVSFLPPADVEYVHKWILHGHWDGAVDVVSHCAAGMVVQQEVAVRW